MKRMSGMAIAVALLTGCNQTDSDSGVTPQEASELNRAAELLDANTTLPDEPAAR